MEEKKAEGEATRIHLTVGNVTRIVWRDQRRQKGSFPCHQVNKRMMSHYVLNCTKRLTKTESAAMMTKNSDDKSNTDDIFVTMVQIHPARERKMDFRLQ